MLVDIPAAARSITTTARLLRSLRGRRVESEVERRVRGALRLLLPPTLCKDLRPSDGCSTDRWCRSRCSISDEENALPTLGEPTLSTNDLLCLAIAIAHPAATASEVQALTPSPARITMLCKQMVEQKRRKPIPSQLLPLIASGARAQLLGGRTLATSQRRLKHRDILQQAGVTLKGGERLYIQVGPEPLISLLYLMVPGNSKIMPCTDHSDADTDAGDDDDSLHLLKKQRTRVAADLGRRTQAPKFRYPPGWEKGTASDRGEGGGSHGEWMADRFLDQGLNKWLISCSKATRGSRRGAKHPERKDSSAEGQYHTQGRPRGHPGSSPPRQTLSEAGFKLPARSCCALASS